MKAHVLLVLGVARADLLANVALEAMILHLDVIPFMLLH